MEEFYIGYRNRIMIRYYRVVKKYIRQNSPRRMSASNAKERDEWLQCINESIRENPLHDFVAAKKASLQSRNHRNR